MDLREPKTLFRGSTFLGSLLFADQLKSWSFFPSYLSFHDALLVALIATLLTDASLRVVALSDSSGTRLLLLFEIHCPVHLQAPWPPIQAFRYSVKKLFTKGAPAKPCIGS